MRRLKADTTTNVGKRRLRALGIAVLALTALAVVAALADDGPVGAAGRRTLAPKAPRVVHALKHDRSRPLREIAPTPPTRSPKAERENEMPPHQRVSAQSGPDPVVQTEAPQASMPAASKSFEGIGNVNGYAPPDTNGDVGPNDYVETVNAAFAVYDKSGTLEYGPADIDTLWNGFGGLCETRNDGDPVVQYDQLADRWLITQFAFDFTLAGDPVGPYYECIAVSTSGDPTGSYYRYAFPISDTKLDDYPKIGVWPDAYYMAVNQFDDSCGGCFVGAAAVAFERSKMLSGQAASLVYFDLGTDFYSMLPADLDGSTTPPSGAAAPFVQLDENTWGYLQDQLELWSFHVDWTTPANSTFTSGATLPTAAFDSDMCGYDRSCIAQPGTSRRLDALSDRLMYRLAYRRFSDHESLVVNHTVDVNGADRGGIRWYELTRTSGSWGIHQQGTYAPADGNTRWLGSAAMDQTGDLAVGYSVSGTGTYPSIRYAGRLAADPLGQLPQGEATLRAGSGSQTGVERWGDYSSLSVDPSDDCTFWFASEYYPASSSRDWHTRVGSFTFPSCGPPPTVDGFTPTSGTPGTSVAITGTSLNGATAVKFAGTTATFTVDSATHVTATVPTGAADGPISVVTPRGTATSSSSFDVVVPAPTIGSLTPASGSVGTSVTIAGTNLNGASAVTFNGTGATFTVVSPTQIATKVPLGATSGPVVVTTPGGTAASASDFTVTIPAPTISSFSPLSGPVGTVVTIGGTNLGAVGTVAFGGVPASFVVVSPTQIKATVPVDGKTGKITATNGGGTATSVSTFKVLPRLTSFGPASGPAGTSVTIAGSGFTDVSSVKFAGVAAASPSVDSDHQITASVPDAATSGKVSVITAGGTATSLATFKAVPTITSFSVGSAAPGSPVTLGGTGFGGVTSVKVNGVGAPFATLSPTSLRLTVPASATSGTVSVTTAGGTATSAATLFVTPRVGSFTPLSAPVGAKLTIYGNAFGGATSVLFDGVLVSPATVTATTITVFVPADASTGKLTVVTPSGSGQSVGTFKVLPRIASFTPATGPAGTSVTITGSGFTDVSAVKFHGVAASSWSVDSSAQITAAVPDAATNGRVSVVTAGGTALSPASFKVVPTITGFAPGSAAPGTSVVVSGTGFGGVSSVKVNGVGAPFATLSPTSLRLTVPASATTGTIAITTAGGVATSAGTLFVTPRVSWFTPLSAPVGTKLTIYGNAFGGATSVLFDGVLASPATVTATTITVFVPADASTGKLTVVTPSGSGQSVGTFKVLPRIASFTPATGPAGTSVTITGSGFTDVSAVKFAGVVATTTSVDSDHQISATVPATALTGRIGVVTAGGTALSPTSFTVTH